jgi:hypothetical protein
MLNTRVVVKMYNGIINEIADELYLIRRRIQKKLKFALRAPAQIRNPGISRVFFTRQFDMNCIAKYVTPANLHTVQL